MLFIWIAIGLLDLLIVFLIVFTCRFTLRGAERDLRARSFPEGHPMHSIQKEVVEGQRFFKENHGERVVIHANGVELSARIYRPKNPVGRILLFHGYRSVPEVDFATAMRFYYSLNYELVLVDQRAHGKSAGSWIGFGVLERYDCLSWTRYMNHEHGVLPTFYAGISMGSTTVLMALGCELPSNVKGVIADCGFTSPKEILTRGLQRKKLPAKLLLHPLSLFFKIFAGYFPGEYSTVEALRSTQIPVLFIHGTKDHLVPVEMTEENYRACRSEKELLLVEGAGHGTSVFVQRTEVEGKIRAFLDRYNR